MKYSVKSKIIISTLVFVVSLFFLKIVSLEPIDISMGFQFSSNSELKDAELSIGSKDAFEEGSIVNNKVLNHEAKFLIDPQFYNPNQLELSIKDIKNQSIQLEKITLYSGLKNIKVASFEGQNLENLLNRTTLDSQNNKIIFSQKGLKEFNSIIQKNSILKLYLLFIVIFVYLVVLLRIVLFAKVKRRNYALGVLSVLIYCIFIGNVFINNSPLLLNREYTKEDVNESAPIAIEPKKEYKQEFISNEKNLAGLQIYFGQLDDNPEAETVVQLIDKSTNKLVNTTIVTPKDFEQQGWVNISFKNSQPNSFGKTYEINIKNVGSDKADTYFKASTNKESEYIEPMIINDAKTQSYLQFFSKFNRINIQMIAVILVSVFLLLLLLTVYYGKLHINPKWVIILIYLLTFVYSVYRIGFYDKYVGMTPDESSHVAYVADLAKEGDVIIPDFKEMTRGKNSETNGVGEFTFNENTTNYLGHPPLYYQILKFTGGAKLEDGKVFVDEPRMSTVSQLIGLSALLLIFYIGYSRIRKIPYLHLTYAMVVTSVPMMIYSMSGITNDTLALLTVTIFVLGVLRFSEEKRNYLTYLLIALGINLTMLTKVTAGIMVVISAILFIAWTIYREKNLKSLLRKEFIVTIPFYLVTVWYFVTVYRQIGAFQPSFQGIATNEFYNSIFYIPLDQRVPKTILDYVVYYFTSFFNTWTNLVSHVFLVKASVWYSIDRIALMGIWIIPMWLFFKKKKAESLETMFLIFFTIAIYITFIMQFSNAATRFFQDGFPGSYQSRYYLCVIVIFALSIIRCLEYFYSRYEETSADLNSVKFDKKKLICVFAIAFSLLLFYEDFIYFILNFTDYLTYLS